MRCDHIRCTLAFAVGKGTGREEEGRERKKMEGREDKGGDGKERRDLSVHAVGPPSVSCGCLLRIVGL